MRMRLHRRQVEDDPALGRAVAGHAVAAAPDGELEPGLGRERHGPGDVGGVCRLDDEGRVAVEAGVVDVASRRRTRRRSGRTIEPARLAANAAIESGPTAGMTGVAAVSNERGRAASMRWVSVGGVGGGAWAACAQTVWNRLLRGTRQQPPMRVGARPGGRWTDDDGGRSRGAPLSGSGPGSPDVSSGAPR